MSAPAFRDATADDLPSIVAMYADDPLGATREVLTDPLRQEYERAFREIERDPRHRLVVVEQDGGVVGTLQLSYLPHLTHLGAERAQIEAVRVAPSHRGTGLGTAMLQWAVEEARRRGCGMVQLTTNATREDAHRFYTALGFQPTHVGMKLDLRSSSRGR